MDQARSALRRHWGYAQFRPGQREAIASILSGRDTLVVMPTGGGKSICYQVPALVRPGLTLVISPLIALMHDQVEALRARGIAAGLVNSTLSDAEIRERLDRAVRGDLKLLYLAPERGQSPVFLKAVRRMDVRLIAVDEAHCVSEWGHDFRPSYLRLPDLWPVVGRPPVIALTATATPEVRRSIVGLLRLRRPRVLVRGFDRPNLRWIVERQEKLAEKGEALVRWLDGGGSAVVYASTRKMVEAAAELLRGSGIDAGAYHAGLPRTVRAMVQERWTSGALRVVVATNAFGMGIDKEDVRRVVHFQMPGSLEAYYQEAGRAGRDGEAADCVLLHSYRDRFTHEFFIRCSYPPRQVVTATYRTLEVLCVGSGGSVPFSRLAHAVPGAKSEGEVRSALRVLCDAGVAAGGTGCARFHIRWIVGADRVDALLRAAPEPEDAAGGGLAEPATRAVLRRLAAASDGGRRRSFRVSRQAIVPADLGGYAAARSALDALQAAGMLGWRPDGGGAGYRLLRRGMAPSDLPVDWARHARRRDLELRKLRRMERYAYRRTCRRRDLLGYFGESVAGYRCGGCDRCGFG